MFIIHRRFEPHITAKIMTEASPGRFHGTGWVNLIINYDFYKYFMKFIAKFVT